MKKLFFVAAIAAICALGSCTAKGHCSCATTGGGTINYPSYSGDAVAAQKAACQANGCAWISE